MLRVTLTHILSQGALPNSRQPNPVGYRHAENILFELAGEAMQAAPFSVSAISQDPAWPAHLDANSSVLVCQSWPCK